MDRYDYNTGKLLRPGDQQSIYNMNTGQKIGDPTSTPVASPTNPTVGEMYKPFQAPTPDAGDASLNKIGSYYEGLANSDVNEDNIRRATLGRFQAEIDATNRVYADKIAEAAFQGQGRLGTSRASQARGGLLGSDFGAAQTDKVTAYNTDITNSIRDQQMATISAILGKADQASVDEIAAKTKAKQEGADSYIKFLTSSKERKQGKLTELGQALLLQGLSPEDIDPSELQKIATSYGVSEGDIKTSYLTAKRAKDAEDIDNGFALSEGQNRYDSKGNLIASGNPKIPASAEEYEFAKQNGYTGSFTEYQNEDANRKAKVAGAGAGGLTPYQQFQGGLTLGAKVDNLVKASKEVVNRASLAQQALDRYNRGEVKDLNATSQVVITNFNKILDPTSVVRESEYARSPEGQSFLAQLEGKAQRIMQGGAGLTPASLNEFVNLGNTFAKKAQASIDEEKSRAVSYAQKFGIDTGYVGGGYNPGGSPSNIDGSQVITAPDGQEIIITD